MESGDRCFARPQDVGSRCQDKLETREERRQVDDGKAESGCGLRRRRWRSQSELLDPSEGMPRASHPRIYVAPIVIGLFAHWLRARDAQRRTRLAARSEILVRGIRAVPSACVVSCSATARSPSRSGSLLHGDTRSRSRRSRRESALRPRRPPTAMTESSALRLLQIPGVGRCARAARRAAAIAMPRARGKARTRRSGTLVRCSDKQQAHP